MPRALKHVHKIIKLESAYGFIWRCTKDDCTYVLHYKQKEFLLGRFNICWTCENVFKFSDSNIDQELPLCLSCTLNTVSKQEDQPSMNDIMEYINSKTASSNKSDNDIDE